MMRSERAMNDNTNDIQLEFGRDGTGCGCGDQIKKGNAGLLPSGSRFMATYLNASLARFLLEELAEQALLGRLDVYGGHVRDRHASVHVTRRHVRGRQANIHISRRHVRSRKAHIRDLANGKRGHEAKRAASEAKKKSRVSINQPVIFARAATLLSNLISSTHKQYVR